MDKIIIDEKLALKRLDEVCFNLALAESRSRCKKLIKDGSILVNNEIKKPHYIVNVDDCITYKKNTNNLLGIQAENIPLDIIYEDEDLLIINKQAGLVVHPGNGNLNHTLVNGLVFYNANLKNVGDEFRPGIVHRIDKDTSGLLCIAKTNLSLTSLSKQLSSHTMNREYYGLVYGIINEDDGKIIAPISRDDKNPTKFKVDAKNGKKAITFFHVEQRFYQSNCTLCSFKLLTGRTHQIRVHLDYIKHPLIGDKVYGKNNLTLYSNGQLLHAYKLNFIHPKTLQSVTFTAPLPDYFSSLLNSLK